MDVPKPTWQPLALHCDSCGQNWDDWLPSGVAAKVLIAAIKAVRCPYCGEGRRLFTRSGE